MLKKIIIVTRSMYAGGAERVIAQLAKYFDSINIECKIITIDDEKVLYDLPKNVEIIAIGKKSSNKGIDRIKRYKLVRQIIKDNKPDLVLSMPEDIGIYVIPSLLGAGIPLVVSERNNPWIMPDKKITRILRSIFYPCLDGIIFQTEKAASFFSKRIREKGIVLNNPLDDSRIPLQYKGIRKKIIVGAGRLDKQKNFKLLITAFSEFYKDNNDYKLVIYGEGAQRKELEELANDLLEENSYSFPGRESNLLEKMNDSAMFILTSDYEGVPNVLIEAMAMGMPVISTDCPPGGPSMLINNENNGLLVPINSVQELVKAMNKLKDVEYSTNLANNALKLRDILSDVKIYEDWVRYLENVLKCKKYKE